LSLSAFHHLNQDRSAHWPQSMLATASHDTKLGEDVRARINVLSEMPVQWGQRAGRWASLNRRRKQDVDGRLAPSRNDEYLLYQTLLGAWPIGLRPDDAPAAEYGAFVDRIKAYMLKATREAKVHTSWSNPNAAYEGALDHFISQALDPLLGRPFLRDFLPFQERIAVFGMLNSLSQTALKMTCPGIPDIYQGSELWDFHLVDPDNRRPVDFDRRERTLAEIRAASRNDERASILERLRDDWHDGRIKQHLIFTLLRLRQQFPHLFLRGSYQSLQVEGSLADRVCAFQRKEGAETLVVAVGRFFAGAGNSSLDPRDHTGLHWNGTELRLGDDVPWPLTDVLTARRTEGPQSSVPLSELFAVLPICVLTGPMPPTA
jgi:(1->4)-alpha-D-glucan 1-alpha-D-glucosylmutase